MPNVKDVLVGAPDQKVTGAIKHAPIGTTLPTLSSITKAAVTLDEDFVGDEYVSEEGLTLTPAFSTADIKEWGGATVRKVLESFDGTLKWKMITTTEGSLGVAFGDENITTSSATTTHGNQVSVALGTHLPGAQSWVFLMKDNDARIVIVVPNGQVTEVADVVFAPNEAVGWEVTLACYPDEGGESIYIYTDDGQVTTTTATA